MASPSPTNTQRKTRAGGDDARGASGLIPDEAGAAPRRRQEAEGGRPAAAAGLGRGREHHQQRPEEAERDFQECSAAALHLRAR